MSDDMEILSPTGQIKIKIDCNNYVTDVPSHECIFDNDKIETKCNICGITIQELLDVIGKLDFGTKEN